MSKLYIVATPIGNLKDITFRAIETLKEVDFILAENPGNSQKLLKAYDIEKPTIKYFQHTENVQKILDLLADGKNLALVSDAGTPGINDPGGKLIEAVLNSGLNVDIVPIPGASALITLLSVAGIPLEEFIYKGFVPHKKGKETFLRVVGQSEIPVVFYESVHRIVKTLEKMKSFLPPNKRLIVGRELTKKFETIYRGDIETVSAQLGKDPVKGEYVIIVY